MTVAAKKVVVVGAGGHGKVVADVAMAAGNKVLGFVDDAPLRSPLDDVPLLGPLAHLTVLSTRQRFKVIIGVGDNRMRKRIAGDLSAVGFEFTSVVAPSAVVSRYAVIGPGTVVMPGVVINAGAVVGAHAILNTGCIVEHDCAVRDHAHLSPGVCLSGGVTVGCGAHLGTGASVIPGRRIGEWAVVGAGAVVIRNVASGVTVGGVPARVIGKNGEGVCDEQRG